MNKTYQLLECSRNHQLLLVSILTAKLYSKQSSLLGCSVASVLPLSRQCSTTTRSDCSGHHVEVVKVGKKGQNVKWSLAVSVQGQRDAAVFWRLSRLISN